MDQIPGGVNGSSTIDPNRMIGRWASTAWAQTTTSSTQTTAPAAAPPTMLPVNILPVNIARSRQEGTVQQRQRGPAHNRLARVTGHLAPATSLLNPPTPQPPSAVAPVSSPYTIPPHNHNTEAVTEFVAEAPKQTPVIAKCDVLVLGGGPAGLSAAIGAARAGADTMLVERFGCFGGVITTVGMETLGWYRYEGTVDCEGVGVEMEKMAARMGGSTKFPYNDSECLDADYFKVVADELVKKNNIRPMLHTWVVDVLIEEQEDGGQHLVGVITQSKSGRQAILAKRVIDCTGDGDVADMAGCPFSTLPKEDRLGVTTVFNCSGVDKVKFLEHVNRNRRTYSDWSRGEWKQTTAGKEELLHSPYLDQEFDKAVQDGILPSDVKISGSWSALSDAGEATNLNLVYMKGFDCTDVFDLTKAEMQGRTNVLYAIRALQHSVPGFEKAKLRNFGMTLGTRDSRKIVGRYNLTEKDVLNQARFLDSVGIFPEFVDGYAILILPTTGRYFQVPYGCLIPQGVDNLLVAGRPVAGDRVSHAATRNMMCCTVTGQGAGVAAAVSIKTGQTTSKVDIAVVQAELRRQGVRIH
eukprot:gb/GEZN01003140.1/.p1 GENE.gb/GEZN01003140.1/~~gb/GEZN01003140.1/.p1  ORF type:complete len:581 (+),score=84.25 gb/GEZN01003140.1/:171-1913(+)